jgi:hypothetical protein
MADRTAVVLDKALMLFGTNRAGKSTLFDTRLGDLPCACDRWDTPFGRHAWLPAWARHSGRTREGRAS